MFTYPKPVIAVLNGHAVAGGCILALTADYRIMVTGKAKISLNEVTFGSSIFASAVEMLRHTVGGRKTEEVLLTGRMYTAEEAESFGLVDAVVEPEDLTTESIRMAHEFASRSNPAYTSLKKLIRVPVAEKFLSRESESIREFKEIWYSEDTWKNLQEITIRK